MNRMRVGLIAGFAISISREKQSVELVMEDNTTHPYQDPPAVAEVTK